ncbi:hypothetical protein EG329_002786 [Mollisiaceae sp. DMI_Dod_QoI]|nr:hypothetical protein EG329_002786 [Helotiales sp. DMI_Dod_QoI]
MNVPLDMRHTPTSESEDISAFSNSSQPLNLYTLPFPPDQYFGVHTPFQSCSWPPMPVTNSGTLIIFVPYLDHSHQQPYPTYQLSYQHTEHDLKPIHYNPSSSPPLSNHLSTTPAPSPATSPNELFPMADSGISTNPLTTNYPHTPTYPQSPPQSPSPNTLLDLSLNHPSPPPPPHHQTQTQTQNPKPTCPLPTCNATFKRIPDLQRHISTIHGLKSPCPHNSCLYQTGRKDKMMEHIRKMHS